MQVGPCIVVGIQLQKAERWAHFWANLASFSPVATGRLGVGWVHREALGRVDAHVEEQRGLVDQRGVSLVGCMEAVWWQQYTNKGTKGATTSVGYDTDLQVGLSFGGSRTLEPLAFDE